MTTFARVCEIAALPLVTLVLVVTPFAFGGVNQNAALLSKTFLSPVLFYFIYFARLGIVLAVMFWLAGMIAAREIRFARTPLDIPIGLFVGYTFLWFMFSKSKALTGGELANILCYVAIYYLVVNNVKTKMQMNVVAGALIFCGFAIATIGLIQSSGYFLPSSGLKNDYAINLLRPEQYRGRVGGTFVCPNHFAGYLEMVIPFALAYVLFSKIPTGRKLLVAFLGLVMVMGLLLSISRGGWVAFAVSAGFLFAMVTREKKVTLASWLVPLMAILVGIAVVVAKSSQVQKRFAESFADESYLKRAHVWLDTMSLIRDHLLIGTGPGTFEMAYREYRRPSVLLAIDYTHNDYLQALSNYGAIGFAILLSGILAFGRKMWRATKKLERRIDKALAYGVMAGVVALLVHSLVDFNMHIPSNAMTMAAIVGLGMSIRQYRFGAYDEWAAISGRERRFFPPVVQLGLIGVVVLVTTGILYLNFRAYASSLTLHRATEKDPSREFRDQDPKEKDLKAAEELYRKAASLFASSPKPWAALAEMHVWNGDRVLDAWNRGEINDFRFLLLDSKEAMQGYRKAVTAIQKGKKQNPLDSRHYLTLARAYSGIFYINDQYKESSPRQYSPSLEKYRQMAEEEFQKALDMDPNNADYHERLGVFYVRIERYDEAERELRSALQIFPDERKYWEQRKHLHERLGLVYDRTGRYGEAEGEIQKALDSIPANAFFKERSRLQKLMTNIRQRRKETEKTG